MNVGRFINNDVSHCAISQTGWLDQNDQTWLLEESLVLDQNCVNFPSDNKHALVMSGIIRQEFSFRPKIKLPRLLKLTVYGKEFHTLTTLSSKICSECYCYSVLYKVYACPLVLLTLLNSKSLQPCQSQYFWWQKWDIFIWILNGVFFT